MPQPLEVADRLPAQDLSHRQIDQELPSVIDRVKPAPGHRRRYPGAEPGLLGQQPQRQRPGQPDQSVVIADKFKPVGP